MAKTSVRHARRDRNKKNQRVENRYNLRFQKKKRTASVSSTRAVYLWGPKKRGGKRKKRKKTFECHASSWKMESRYEGTRKGKGDERHLTGKITWRKGDSR